MTTIVYGLIQDCGDGSSCLRWFTDLGKVRRLLEEDESFYANEGSPAAEIIVPIGMTPEQLGIDLDDDEEEF